MKALFAIVLFSISIFVYPVIVYSENNNSINKVKYESINPDSGFYYKFKRLLEKTELIFTRDDKSKAQLYSKLLDKRFREIAFLVEKNKIGPLEVTTNRYNSTAGEILGKYKKMDPALPKKAGEYLKKLEILKNEFKTQSAQWLLIQQTIDTTKRLVD